MNLRKYLAARSTISLASVAVFNLPYPSLSLDL